MALRTPLTVQPHLYIGDPTGRPLNYGIIYFGEPNKDPEFYPIKIYLDPEMTIETAQPVRTQNGFVTFGGDLTELHAEEVIYSIKVLDKDRRQIFYKPEMYRNNVSDFLQDEILRATSVEGVLTESLSNEVARATNAETVITGNLNTEIARATNAEQLLDDKITSVAGGKKSYATYALMTADAANIPANSSIDVLADTDSTKNGMYAYDGTSFTKSVYDPLTQANAYTDEKSVSLSYYYKGNLVSSYNQVRTGIVLASSYNITASSTSNMAGFSVTEGDTLYISNLSNNFSVSAAYGYAFYTNSDLSTIIKTEQVTVTPVEIRDVNGLIIYHKVVVPAGAKLIAFNTQFNSSTITWNIHKDEMSTDYSPAEPLVEEISGKELKVYEPNYTLIKDGNLFDKTKGIRNGYFVKEENTTVTPTTPPSIVASSTSTTAFFDVSKNAKYYAKINAPAEYPVLFLISEYSQDYFTNKANLAIDFGTLYTASYKLVDSANSIYEITIPEGIASPKTLMTNVILVAGIYNFNIIDTFELYKSWVNDTNAQLNAYSDLNSKGFIDTQARKELQKVSSGLLKPNGGTYTTHAMQGKRVFTFGDSITWGTQGGFVKYYESELRMKVNNYGVSGDTTASLREVMLGRNGNPTLDYTQADVVTIMIGTNNRTSSTTYWSSLVDIPTDTVYDHVADSSTAAYFDSFPATFAGDVSACVEYVKWKNPRCKIYLVSPPIASLYSTESYDRVQYYKQLADTYSLTFVNGTQNSGLSIKDIGVWSYDGVHFNELGNDVFGKFMVKNIAFK